MVREISTSVTFLKEMKSTNLAEGHVLQFLSKAKLHQRGDPDKFVIQYIVNYEADLQRHTYLWIYCWEFKQTYTMDLSLGG